MHTAVERNGRRKTPWPRFASARKNGVYGIELDIQRCKTGELVVIHDEDLKRTTNGAGLIKDTSLADLNKLDAGSWFGEQFKNERVPLLPDVLKLLDGKVVLNIEIKNTPIAYPGIEDDLLKVLADYKYPDTIIISSFDHEVLKRLHAKSSKICNCFAWRSDNLRCRTICQTSQVQQPGIHISAACAKT